MYLSYIKKTIYDKKFINFVKISLGVLAISPLIYGYLYYNYDYKKIPITVNYEESIMNMGKDLSRKIKEKKLKGWVGSIGRIEGSTGDFVHRIRSLVNAQLYLYDGWKVVINEEERKKTVERINKYLARMNVIKDPSVLIKSATEEVAPNYYAQCFYSSVPGHFWKGKIELKIVDSVSKNSVVESSAIFTKPFFENLIKFFYALVRYLSAITFAVISVIFSFLIIKFLFKSALKFYYFLRFKKFKSKFKDLVEKGMFISAKTLMDKLEFLNYEELKEMRHNLEFITFNNPEEAENAFLVLKSLKEKWDKTGELSLEEEKKISEIKSRLNHNDLEDFLNKYSVVKKEKWDSDKERIEEYLKNGDFIVAKEIMDSYLCFLNEPSLSALKERLDFVTNGNVKEAQNAFLKFKNIYSKYLKGIIPDEKDMKALYEIREKIEMNEIDLFIKEVEIRKKQIKANMLISEGKAEEAKKIISEIDGENYHIEENKRIGFEKIKEEADKITAQQEKEYLEVLNMINNLNLDKAIESITKNYLRNEKLDTLYRDLDNTRSIKSLKLSFINPNNRRFSAPLYIFFKKELEMFRENIKKPDINLLYDFVSRDGHLKIVFEGEKFFVKNVDSKNGVFINSVPIIREELKIDSNIKIANQYPILSKIYCDDSLNSKFLFLKSKDFTAVLIPNQTNNLKFKILNGFISVCESEDFDFSLFTYEGFKIFKILDEVVIPGVEFKKNTDRGNYEIYKI